MSLEFKRLTEVDPRDIIALMNNPLVVRHMPLASARFDETDCAAFVDAKEKLWAEHGYGPWAFVVDGRFAGWGGLQPEEGEADLALVLHPAFWGWGREIFERVLQIGFGGMGFESVMILLPPSRARLLALPRLGFVPDGMTEIVGKSFHRFRRHATDRLGAMLRFVEAGGRLATRPCYRVVASPGTHTVMAFPGLNVIVTDLSPEWVAEHLPEEEDLSAPLNPPFLGAMEEKTGRRVNNIDIVMLGTRLDGPPGLELTVVTDMDHPRVRRAHRYRRDVTVYQAQGGVLIVGRGVGARWEVAVEVEEGAQGKGLGRALALAARHLVPENRPIWAQIAPGNATSVRAFIAAGYVPVGAEALLVT